LVSQSSQYLPAIEMTSDDFLQEKAKNTTREVRIKMILFEYMRG
jgi:hypothetical protein